MSTLKINNISDVAGTGAPDFVAMPTVGGDSVVESGSNSDGTWSNFADGTSIQWFTISLNGTATNSKTLPFPLTGTSYGISGASASSSNSSVVLKYSDKLADSINLLGAVSSGGSDSYSANNFSVHLIGKWK